LNQKIRGIVAWRTIYYLPAVLPQIAGMMLWGWIFDVHGVLNYLLSLLGIPAVSWLTNEHTVLPSFIIMSLWYAGSGVLIYLAAMQNVPTEFYEAAEIDGANAWQRFWRITIPQISPILFMQLIFTIIGSLQTFNQVIVMIGNNPNPGALFFSFYVYQQFFLSKQYGYASALSWLLFAIIAVITALTFKWSQAWVYYEGMRTRGR
ncbi:MAG: carbohydrate ABC transporter permease, partial [Bacteroidota bacterium]